MKSLIINLSDYDLYLNSRLLGREIINEHKSDIICAEKIIINFNNVKEITLSFTTEILDSLHTLNNNFEIINVDSKLSNLIRFCISNLKQKDNLILN
jgi:hypothetical protein